MSKLVKHDDPADLLADIRSLVAEARQTVATAVNAELPLLYWRVGRRIREETLKGERAAYGEQIVAALSERLTADYGQGFSRRNLFNMIRFAEAFPDERIVHALRAQLSWTHFKSVIYMDDPLKRDFYAEMCRIERWSIHCFSDFAGRTSPNAEPIDCTNRARNRRTCPARCSFWLLFMLADPFALCITDSTHA